MEDDPEQLLMVSSPPWLLTAQNFIYHLRWVILCYAALGTFFNWLLGFYPCLALMSVTGFVGRREILDLWQISAADIAAMFRRRDKLLDQLARGSIAPQNRRC